MDKSLVHQVPQASRVPVVECSGLLRLMLHLCFRWATYLQPLTT